MNIWFRPMRSRLAARGYFRPAVVTIRDCPQNGGAKPEPSLTQTAFAVGHAAYGIALDGIASSDIAWLTSRKRVTRHTAGFANCLATCCLSKPAVACVETRLQPELPCNAGGPPQPVVAGTRGGKCPPPSLRVPLPVRLSQGRRPAATDDRPTQRRRRYHSSPALVGATPFVAGAFRRARGNLLANRALSIHTRLDGNPLVPPEPIQQPHAPQPRRKHAGAFSFSAAAAAIAAAFTGKIDLYEGDDGRVDIDALVPLAVAAKMLEVAASSERLAGLQMFQADVGGPTAFQVQVPPDALAALLAPAERVGVPIIDRRASSSR
jgi:hypothetical protein